MTRRGEALTAFTLHAEDSEDFDPLPRRWERTLWIDGPAHLFGRVVLPASWKMARATVGALNKASKVIGGLMDGIREKRG